jgi:hypothetical protein
MEEKEFDEMMDASSKEVANASSTEEKLELMSKQIRVGLIFNFQEALKSNNFDDAEKVIAAYQKYKNGYLALQKHTELLLNKRAEEFKDDMLNLDTKEGRAAYRAKLAAKVTETQ